MGRRRLHDLTSTEKYAARTPSRQDWGTIGLLDTLRNSPPTQWSANQFELARHFRNAVFIAINTLAKHAADSTLIAYERTDDPNVPDGERLLAWNDPIHQTFEDPNPAETFADIMYQEVQQRGLTGRSYTWTIPTDRDEPREIYNLPSSTVMPMPPGWYEGYAYPQGAYRVLPYTYGLNASNAARASAGAVIAAEQVHRVINHHPFIKGEGYAVLTAISQHVDTFDAIADSRFATMQQGCEQSLALNAVDKNAADPEEGEIKRTRKNLDVVYGGPKNAGKIFFTPVGWKLEQIATAPKDMAWSEGWQQVLSFILAAYGVPMPVAGFMDSGSFATIATAFRAFCELSLGPEVRKPERVWTKRIVRPSWGRQFGIHIVPPVLKDEQLDENQLKSDLQCGALTVGEVRRLHRRPHIDEPWTKERAIASYSPQSPTGGGPGGRELQPEQSKPSPTEDPQVNNMRPAAAKADRLADVLEKAKTNGHARPIKTL